jgi:hypothetical protein
MRSLTRSILSLTLASAFLVACAAPADPTVYVVEKGKSYHLKNCRMKSGSHAVKLSWAKKNKYQPCKVCKPPK